MAGKYLGWLACIQAFVALVVAMSLAIATCAFTFGWFGMGEKDPAGFVLIWLASIFLIPLRIVAPFFVCWIALRRYDYVRPLYFIICGGLCGIAVIVTFPMEQFVLLPKLNFELLLNRWQVPLLLLFSGCIGGLAAWAAARRALSVF